jgi:hypothetical protein
LSGSTALIISGDSGLFDVFGDRATVRESDLGMTLSEESEVIVEGEPPELNAVVRMRFEFRRDVVTPFGREGEIPGDGVLCIVEPGIVVFCFEELLGNSTVGA